MNGLNYLIQTNLYLLLFMGFYVLVLRNETFFRQNRFFLNTSIFLSFLIPFFNSDWFRDLFITQRVREAAIMPTQMMYETIIVGATDTAPTLSVSDALFWVYASGATFLLSRFLLRLMFLKSRLTVTKGSAFSFFNTLVVDTEIPKSETIIGHEKVHMRQWHSADIIFIELAAIVNWFNPVMYLYKKEIRHIHEFIADEEAAKLMQSKSDYAMLLFSNTLGVDPLHLTNNFFNKSLLKRRILMLHKTKSRSTGLWKYGFSAPLFILMLIVSAAAASSENNLLSVDGERTIKPIEHIASIPLPEIITGKAVKA
ncbi:MAG: M56 family metallopeptidase, partial [Daejeonella sp.]|uniref:M56 family metallopeptidase n=1 Tax=Daejeonella sp. TaxID=2805397 RepID=UPI003C7871B3